MYSNDSQSLSINDLKSIEKINGKELILIQDPDNDETNNISVNTLLSAMVQLLVDAGNISIKEKDPTVPSYIKAMSEEDIEKWNNAASSVAILEDKVSRLQSSTIKITNFTVRPTVVELGTVLNTVTLTWDINFRNLIRQSVDDVDIPDLTKRFRIMDGPFRESKSFTLKVEGDDGNTDTKIADLKFYNSIYYGSSRLTPISSNFLNGDLNRVLTGSKTQGFTVVSREQEYIYVALPARFGEPTFEIISEVADFEFVKEFDHENSSGYVEPYNVYRTTNVHLGQTTIRMR